MIYTHTLTVKDCNVYLCGIMTHFPKYVYILHFFLCYGYTANCLIFKLFEIKNYILIFLIIIQNLYHCIHNIYFIWYLYPRIRKQPLFFWNSKKKCGCLRIRGYKYHINLFCIKNVYLYGQTYFLKNSKNHLCDDTWYKNIL